MAFSVMVVLSAAFVAAFTDVIRFRVYNILTIPLIVSGVVYHSWLRGLDGFAFSATGLLFGFSVLLVFFAMGGMGAGDVKLMAGVGAWLGVVNTLWVFLASALISGLYAIVLIVVYRQYRQTWGNLRIIWYRIRAVGRQLGSEENLEREMDQFDRRKRLIPFASMMAIGMVVLLILAYVLPQS